MMPSYSLFWSSYIVGELLVIFEMFYDLWIPVIKTSDFMWCAIFVSGTRGYEFSGAVKINVFLAN